MATSKSQALHNFWSQFGLTAYDESTVPEDAVLPYITYTMAEDNFNHSVSLTASLWYRSRSWSDITAKATEISKAIGLGGVMVKYDDGAIWIQKGSPFAQRVADTDDSIRRIFMNIEAEYLGD